MEDYLDNMVMKKRWRPQVPHSLPKYLTEQEYARVKMAAELLPPRDRALILFLFSSGCRKSEVAQLSIQDVDLERRTVEVKGKGKKIRKVHFSEECALVLKDYLRTRSGDRTEPLFMNKFGQPLRQNGIYNITTKLGRLAGLEQSLHPRCCRHTFVTNMLAKYDLSPSNHYGVKGYSYFKEVFIIKENQKNVLAKRVNIVQVKLLREKTMLYKEMRIRSPNNAYKIFQELVGDRDREVFAITCLNTKNEVNCFQIVHIGSINASIVHPRDVMKSNNLLQ